MANKAFSVIRYFITYFVRAFPGSPFRKFRNILWRLAGFQVHLTANIMPSASLICGDIFIGKETFIGDEALITGGNISIGNSCDLAPRVILHAGSHECGGTHRRAGKAYSGQIAIGDGSWIGTGTIILDGAHIGQGVVVAAGSVVTKGDYPDNCLLAGVPARVKKELNL